MMKHVYVLERIATDEFYADSHVIKPCFSSLDKAVSYVKENYKDAEEIENDNSRVFKSFNLNPNDDYHADFKMIYIYEIEVE